MAGKYILLLSLSLLILIALTDAQLKAVNGRIKITTGTTSGCPHTVNFITQQLAGAYEAYKDFLDIEFIPWGRTVINADGTMTCQFRDADCFANRYQRCALEMLKGNQQAQMNFMNCDFSDPRPSFLLGRYDCAVEAGLNLVELDLCVAIGVGDQLDTAAQTASVMPMQIMNAVPFIVFNDEINVDIYSDARNRLKSLICFALAEVPDSGISNCQI